MQAAQTHKRRFNWKSLIILAVTGLAWQFNPVLAQDSTHATITLSFDKTDSSKTVNAKLMAGNNPVAGSSIQLYVKGMYTLLAMGKAATTDDQGVASIPFPVDMPGDAAHNITLIAKMEGDEKYGDAEATAVVKWGADPKYEDQWNHRSLSASRDRAPMILVVVSISIIAVIWSTIFYIIYQLVRIKKSGIRVTAETTSAG